MRATYQFQNSPKLISNWGESLEKDLLLPVHHSNPAVGVVGKENIVLAVEKTVTDPRSTTNILPLDNTGLILAYTGCVRDAPFLVKRVRVVIKYCEHLPIRPEYVARYVAGVRRQLDFYGRKPYSLLTLIVGFEPSTSSHELWVAHPSGIVRKRLAQAIGRDFDLRNEFLSKNYDYQETSGQTAVKLAIRALLEVGESGEKKIEVTVITREHGPKPLKQAEIDAIIAEIEAEKGASEKEASIDELEAEKGASEKEAIIDELEAEKGASGKEAIIDELEAEKAASEKAAAEKERKKKAAAKKKKRKAKKLAAEAVKKTLPDKPLDDIIAADLGEMDTEPLDDIIAADLAEMDTERAADLGEMDTEPLDDIIAADLAEMDTEGVEMGHVEGPEVDEIKAENATHTWISKIFSCLLFTGI